MHSIRHRIVFASAVMLGIVSVSVPVLSVCGRPAVAAQQSAGEDFPPVPIDLGGDPAAYGFETVWPPSISHDGEVVAFTFWALCGEGRALPNEELCPPGRQRGANQLCVYNRKTGEATPVNRDCAGRAYHGGYYTSISSDGRFVVSSGGPYGLDDADVLKDQPTLYTIYDRRKSRLSGEHHAWFPQGVNTRALPWSMEGPMGLAMSGNGRVVAVPSGTVMWNADHQLIPMSCLVLHDRRRGQPTVVLQRPHRGGWFNEPVLNANGRYLAFSTLQKLVTEDDNDVGDVYLYARETKVVELISHTDDGTAATGGGGIHISADARYVAYYSRTGRGVAANNTGEGHIVVRDRLLKQNNWLSKRTIGKVDGQLRGQSSMSSDGRFFALIWGRGPVGIEGGHLFLYDHETGHVAAISHESWDNPRAPALSGDGRYVAFWVRHGPRDKYSGYYDSTAAGTGLVITRNPLAN